MIPNEYNTEFMTFVKEDERSYNNTEFISNFVESCQMSARKNGRVVNCSVCHLIR